MLLGERHQEREDNCRRQMFKKGLIYILNIQAELICSTNFPAVEKGHGLNLGTAETRVIIS